MRKHALLLMTLILLLGLMLSACSVRKEVVQPGNNEMNPTTNIDGICNLDSDCKDYCFEKGNRGVISYTSLCKDGKCDCVCLSGKCD